MEKSLEKLDYLINEKNVKHIRYYCFSNEMSQIKWGALLEDLPLFKEYQELLYREFQKRGLPIGLLATDASPVENWTTVDWAMDNMSRLTEVWAECESFLGWGSDVRYNKWGLTKWEENNDYSPRDTFWSNRSISLAIINRDSNPRKLQIALDLDITKDFRRYEYDSRNVPRNDFADLQGFRDYLIPTEKDQLEVEIIPEGITLLTTDYIRKSVPVRAKGVSVKNRIFAWRHVADDT